MDGLWNPAADSALRNEVLGFTNYTLLAVLGLLVMIFIVRLLTMRFAPTVLGTIIRSEAIKGKTVQDSDKALGTAVGVGLAYVLIGIMIDDMERVGSPVLMPELAASFLPGILQFVVAIAVVEGIGRQLDPELDLLREAGPFLARAVVKGAREGW